MNREQREDALRRYMEREMSAQEEREFLIRIERDPELRLELRALSIVDAALEKSRSALEPPPAGMEARLTSSLEQPSGAATSGSVWGAAAIWIVLALSVAAIALLVVDHLDTAAPSPAPRREPSVTLQRPAADATPSSPLQPQDRRVNSSAPAGALIPSPRVKYSERGRSANADTSEIEAPRLVRKHHSPDSRREDSIDVMLREPSRPKR